MNELLGSVRDPATALADALALRRPGYSLPGELYHDPAYFALELELLWQREWVLAGHVCELREPGEFLTLTVGTSPLVVVRGHDGEIRALHNVCRHRGSIVCEAAHGVARRRLVCPYHQWSYELDGRLARARSIADDVETGELGLAPAGCEVVGGLIFVSVADEPRDVGPLRELVEPYLEAFGLESAKVAHETTAVEHGNWKLVVENNRECFHCRSAHPELCATFPDGTQHSGTGTAEELRALVAFVDRCETLGLPSRFRSAPDAQFRAMRLPLVDGARSMTRDGAPAVGRRLGSLGTGDTGDADVGDMLLYHYPSTWNHFMADHAVTFRILPVGPMATELRTTWLVPGDAVEGRDYDVARLTEVWEATNRQDTALVERVQRGVRSPAYRPGPYAPVEEEGVIQFVDWYADTLGRRLALGRGDP